MRGNVCHLGIVNVDVKALDQAKRVFLRADAQAEDVSDAHVVQCARERRRLDRTEIEALNDLVDAKVPVARCLACRCHEMILALYHDCFQLFFRV